MTEAAQGRFARRRVGEIEVLSLFDGRIDGSLALFPESERDALSVLARAAGLDPDALAIDVLAFLIRTSGRTILVDTGTGPSRGEALGHVGAALAAAGVSPGEIDTVFMTHLHGDHAGALLDGEGRPAFPNAALVLAEAERAFWSDPGLPARAPERMAATIRMATAALAAWEGRIDTVEGEAEIAPGVTAVPMPGHTPGHAGLRIENGEERLLIFADLFHVPALQAPKPELAILYDIDGPAASSTRLRVLAMAADQEMPVAGMHLPFPGFGRIAWDGEAFAYAPE